MGAAMSDEVEHSEAAEAFALSPPGEGGGKRLPKASNDTGSGRRYKQGVPRGQAMLLPASVEDYIAADNPVRAIDAYVESLDLKTLGFGYAEGALSAGQPAYRPGDLLKLYIYGYLNRVRSSRRLEAECGRNLELVWLLGGLAPSYHTIADFRADNAKALRATCRDFVAECAQLGLIGGTRLGIDGSFFHGSASDASVKTVAQLKAELAAIERDIERYHSELDGCDADEVRTPEAARASVAQLEALKARAAERSAQLKQLADAGETQLSRTDPDARRLRKNGQKVTGYNVQNVVDGKHMLILTHEVTNAGNDLGQLVPMIEQAETVLAQLALSPDCNAEAPCSEAPNEAASPEPAAAPAAPCATAPEAASEEPVENAPQPARAGTAARLEVLADAGYFTEQDIAACQARGICVYVPIPQPRCTSAERRGLLPIAEFRYDAERDCYDCPGGATLGPIGKPVVRSGVARQRYHSKPKVCAVCPQAAQCLSEGATRREIERSEHAEAIERHREHMDAEEARGKMRERAALCEHPFGTLKRWLGWDHFLVRGFAKVRGEMALSVQCYNLRRVLSILGIEAFVEACRKRRHARRAEARRETFSRVFWRLARRSRRFSARFGPPPAILTPSTNAPPWAPPAVALAA